MLKVCNGLLQLMHGDLHLGFSGAQWHQKCETKVWPEDFVCSALMSGKWCPHHYTWTARLWWWCYWLLMMVMLLLVCEVGYHHDDDGNDEILSGRSRWVWGALRGGDGAALDTFKPKTWSSPSPSSSIIVNIIIIMILTNLMITGPQLAFGQVDVARRRFLQVRFSRWACVFNNEISLFNLIEFCLLLLRIVNFLKSFGTI